MYRAIASLRSLASTALASACGTLTLQRRNESTGVPRRASLEDEDEKILSELPFKVSDIACGQRRALAKSITLVESDNPLHARKIGALLRSLRMHRFHQQQRVVATVGTSMAGSGSSQPPPPASSIRAAHATTTTQRLKAHCPRIAISGSPGAGKSCFIEAFGLYLVEKLNLSVAVIAVDPSSTVTQGSILGDKTRMEKLGMHPKAYVRPSPSRGHLGGVTARCWEVMELLDSAGFDVILVETVGVGQSEVEIKHMTDLMMLLVPPASGDELQGIKKGIVEVADMIVVTKNDGEKQILAQQTKAAYTRAAHFSQGVVEKPVVAISSQEGSGMDTTWNAITDLWQKKDRFEGDVEWRRRDQRRMHLNLYFEKELLRRAKDILSA
eukprot:CAMPEP_0176439930 /NCGR_PEP_ID=MMETSP0127-20121128/20259_1 /TAXON_ID=938130 /ORGANISM="Platyophrya macrostoma, Strain WH" /LENGTH=382 /DNA_ID=CAMNT_0017824339 /DNA_START=195 /DNA_END=1339 /DNA_ORIENTATION=+